MNARPLLAAQLAALLALAACAAPTPSPAPSSASPPAPAAPQAPAADASVKPGINDPFLAADLDVDHFVDTFEGESREVARERAAIVAVLALRPGEDVADVGAGTGLFLEPLAHAVGNEGRVYALDIAPPFVEHLGRRAREAGLPQVEARLCTERSVDLPDAAVDLAFVCDTYHHFEHPRDSLASLHRALRPGGRLVVVDFERLPGVSRDWVLDHVRAGKDVVRAEIEAAGFRFVDEPVIPGLAENYVMRFRRE
jgi:ubiquinone/menaquinone biosynthesis C-methylase UbiE